MKRIVAVQPDSHDPRFSDEIITWQQQFGRHALPWQNTGDAYRIWLSEIMLQQTQVAAVIPYYQKFLQRFPDVQSLADAPSEAVMALWSGLGYYTRARNLHRCAQQIVKEYGGIFPSDPALLQRLPGIGRSTAAAIAAFAYGTRAAILDGNVKRVFCRVFGVAGFPGSKPIEDKLWQQAEQLLPMRQVGAYTQGLMDLGATLCTRTHPACVRCPLASRCVALASGRVHLLPERKPKKITPQRHTVMLVIIDRDQVLLEQRPNSGIWGGLLSLPEITSAADEPSLAIDEVLPRAVVPFGELQSWRALTPFAHAFTHFKLQVTPYLVTLSRRRDEAGQHGHVWFDTTSLADAPLPAPVKKLLLALYDPQDLFAA
jgi:A/G-specific adenine glycosylase